MAQQPALVERVLAALRTRGIATAQQLAAALGASQPSISRALTAAGTRAVRIGRARRTRYAAVRDVRGLGSEWPLYRIDAQGRPHAFGQLTCLHGGGNFVATAANPDWLQGDFAEGLFPGLPWFLDDQRPQGFLGRQFAHRWARDLDLPQDLTHWNDDAVLVALLLHGDDLPGNFVLGERALEDALRTQPDPIPAAARAQRYAALADAVLAGELAGSSVAGEQPKFTACVKDTDGPVRHVIVKFSEPVDGSPAARRWADLLIAEHLASELLAARGHASARTELVWSQGRACLEATRFDRCDAHGRRGCVTLAAWNDAYLGARETWPVSAARMQQGGWIYGEAVAQIQLRWWFGRLIGNTDMHFGNLAFYLDDALPLTLAPGYDMLPMLYRPASNGAIVPRAFEPPPPTPVAQSHWNQAAALAERYWGEVAQHADVSAGFRAIAAANRTLLHAARARFDPAGAG